MAVVVSTYDISTYDLRVKMLKCFLKDVQHVNYVSVLRAFIHKSGQEPKAPRAQPGPSGDERGAPGYHREFPVYPV